MFLDWINQYSELHFQVIAAIYNSNGISRGAIWRNIGKNQIREDSAEADLYKLLFLSRVLQGNFLDKTLADRRIF